MDSSGASSLKTTLLTPFGSLKSKFCGAASAAPVRVVKPNKMSSFWCMFLVFMFVVYGKRAKRRPEIQLPTAHRPKDQARGRNVFDTQSPRGRSRHRRF